MGVVFMWVLICIAAYVTAKKAEPLDGYHQKITALKKDREKIDEKSTAPVDLIAKTALDTQIKKAEEDLAPHQAPIEYSFYALAIAVGLVMGGIQSLSRSTYSKLMPETKDTASYFSYYDLTEKIAIVIGMLSFGYLDELMGGMTNSILALIVFFVIGFLWLYSAHVKQKKAQ